MTKYGHESGMITISHFHTGINSTDYIQKIIETHLFIMSA